MLKTNESLLSNPLSNFSDETCEPPADGNYISGSGQVIVCLEFKKIATVQTLPHFSMNLLRNHSEVAGFLPAA